MIKFIYNIIYCLLNDIIISKKISHKALSTSLNKTNKEFTQKLYRENNAVTPKI